MGTKIRTENLVHTKWATSRIDARDGETLAHGFVVAKNAAGELVRYNQTAANHTIFGVLLDHLGDLPRDDDDNPIALSPSQEVVILTAGIVAEPQIDYGLNITTDAHKQAVEDGLHARGVYLRK